MEPIDTSMIPGYDTTPVAMGQDTGIQTSDGGSILNWIGQLGQLGIDAYQASQGVPTYQTTTPTGTVRATGTAATSASQTFSSSNTLVWLAVIGLIAYFLLRK